MIVAQNLAAFCRDSVNSFSLDGFLTSVDRLNMALSENSVKPVRLEIPGSSTQPGHHGTEVRIERRTVSTRLCAKDRLPDRGDLLIEQVENDLEPLILFSMTHFAGNVGGLL